MKMVMTSDETQIKLTGRARNFSFDTRRHLKGLFYYWFCICDISQEFWARFFKEWDCPLSRALATSFSNEEKSDASLI